MSLKYHSLCIIFSFLILIFIAEAISSSPRPVLIVDTSGTIDQSTVELIKEGFNEANRINAEAIILIINTPGGGLSQTLEIAEMITDSSIPVVGYVYPKGSAAWSSGTFLLMSTHIAAMADHTIIGSCQPVEIRVDGMYPVNDSKTINALVQWLQERASMYNRNITLAEEFVTRNRNVNATVAYDNRVIEHISTDITNLLVLINGTQVKTIDGNKTLSTIGSEIVWYKPSIGVLMIRFFSNPVLSSLLLMIGVFSLIIGISTPGHGAEVLGGLAILLSLIGSGFNIPILSIIFLVVGAFLLIIEVYATPGFGIIGVGGIISLIIGSLFLIPSYTTNQWLISRDYMNNAILVMLVVISLISAFFVFLLYKIIQIRRKKPSVGVLLGQKAKTIDRLTPGVVGYIRFKGEYWQAKSDTTIEPGEDVIIIGKEETVLIVEPKSKQTKG
ncbi:MAG: nodulation protein NfeD [Candidatus Thermoplasmatota archaeon]